MTARALRRAGRGANKAPLAAAASPYPRIARISRPRRNWRRAGLWRSGGAARRSFAVPVA